MVCILSWFWDEATNTKSFLNYLIWKVNKGVKGASRRFLRGKDEADRVIGNWFGFFRRFSDQGLTLRSAACSERHANMLTLGRSRYLRMNPGLSYDMLKN